MLMAVNRVDYAGETLIDISSTTATASSILSGFGCFGKDGKWINGSASGGGLPSGFSKIATGEDVISTAFTTTRRTVTHNLGVVPDIVIYFHEGNIATTNTMLMAQRSTLWNYRSSTYTSWMMYHGNSTTTVTNTNSSSASYGVSNLTSTTFQIASAGTSYYWRAGTYKWIAIKFS